MPITTRYASAATPTKKLVLQSMGIGIVAGLVFACGEILVAQMMGASPLAPIEMFASVALGRAAMEGAYTLPTIITVGAIVHLVLSAAFGAGYGVFMRYRSPDTETSLARESGLGILYGLVVWAFNFYIVSPALFPWFLEAPPLTQALLHSIGYGLPLGLMLAAVTRRLGAPRMYAQTRAQRRVQPPLRSGRPL